jgi:multidrug resistance efflux pump
MIAAQRHQLEVLQGTKKQRAADLEATKATLAAAQLKLGYTKIIAPFDDIVSERQVQPGDYVNIGTNLISVVPLPNVYVIANYKETQLTHVEPGQPVEITVDSFPKKTSTAASSESRRQADRSSRCCRPITPPAISPKWSSGSRCASRWTGASRSSIACGLECQ